MIQQPSKEYTKQENLIAECLDSLGIRYAQQISCGKYILDFVIESTIALEADGVYGHFSKREKERDLYVKTCYNYIVHIESQSKKEIMKELEEKLLCLED